MSTKIEWTDEVWNPVTGCTKVSAGCKNCYAETIANRFWGDRKFTDVRMHPERLDIPLKWKKPRRIFVNSMSDLFHEDVSAKFIFSVFQTMMIAHQHTYQILTKRPERMKKLLVDGFGWIKTKDFQPLPNVWLGVSCEDQATADERMPLLLQTPAAIRFVSLEPLLGPIKLANHGIDDCPTYYDGCNCFPDWVIVGGESGPNARPMHPDWVRSIRDQCQEAGVPFFFKQWGEYTPVGKSVDGEDYITVSTVMRRVGKKAAGRLLDGREWNEYPEAS